VWQPQSILEAIVNPRQLGCRSSRAPALHACLHAITTELLERHILESHVTVVLAVQVIRAREAHHISPILLVTTSVTSNISILDSFDQNIVGRKLLDLACLDSVVLVQDDRCLHVMHHDILIVDVVHVTVALRVRFDFASSRCPSEGHIPHCQVVDGLVAHAPYRRAVATPKVRVFEQGVVGMDCHVVIARGATAKIAPSEIRSARQTGSESDEFGRVQS
jgi:hypothetical protein